MSRASDAAQDAADGTQTELEPRYDEESRREFARRMR